MSSPISASPAMLRQPLVRAIGPAFLLALLAAPSLASARAERSAAHPVVVVAPNAPQLTPDYWVSRLADANRVRLSPEAVAAQNARMAALDPHIEDLARLPSALPGTDVAASLSELSTRPNRTLYDVQGQALDAAAIDVIVANAAADAVPATVTPRYGLTVARADLRSFPTAQRVFSTRGDIDIDRFQESALFPGDAVAVLHESRDGQWYFVASQRYCAWVEKRRIALGSRDQVLGYGQRRPVRVITAGTARTSFTPDRPAVSNLQLDMGIALPLRADWPAGQPVNGQDPYTSWVLDLPVRNDDGSLAFAPALLPRTADTAAAPLPLTPANLIRQGFKFLGERYGWGHAFDTRDCSGFVSEVYRSVGLLLPRNTSAQAVSPALQEVPLPPPSDRAGRLAALQALKVGDLVYIPGHVMMVIGHDAGLTWVIHDTSGTSYTGADGKLVRARLNGVSVTPLEPMRYDADSVYADHITHVRRIPEAIPAP